MQLHSCMRSSIQSEKCQYMKNLYLPCDHCSVVLVFRKYGFNDILILFHEAVKTSAKHTYLFWQNIFMIPDVLACKLKQ